MIGVATRLDPLPTTFDHPRPDTTLPSIYCQYNVWLEVFASCLPLGASELGYEVSFRTALSGVMGSVPPRGSGWVPLVFVVRSPDRRPTRYRVVVLTS